MTAVLCFTSQIQGATQSFVDLRPLGARSGFHNSLLQTCNITFLGSDFID